MLVEDHQCLEQTAIRTDLGAIFVSLELSRSTWLITSLSPGAGEKMSRRSVAAGDMAGLLERFARLRQMAHGRMGKAYRVLVIQEAGLDGFWLHRVLQQNGIESHVVDPASIATPRRRRRAKTDRLDGEALLRALLANAVQGVSAGFTKQLDIVGVGYRAEVKEKVVQFALGYSHPVIFAIPEGIKIEIDRTNKITVSGADRQKVGQVAAEIRGLRRPDPYKGKGIKYTKEILRRKVGKAGGK